MDRSSDLGCPDPIERANGFSIKPAETAALLLLLLTQLVVRLQFWPRFPLIGDATNYAFGALVSNVAHPPGSVGYCMLGGVLNHIFHNIQTTFLLMNIVCSLLATGLCYLLAKSFDLSWTAALVAAALYGFSINTLVSGLMIGPYIFEGLSVILFALLARWGMREDSGGYALAATIVFAAAGALRPTTTYLLMPLWCYSVIRMSKARPNHRFASIALHATVALTIILAWYSTDDYYMTKAGYGNRVYELQALMPSTYEYATFSSVPTIGPAHFTYHMPIIEFVAWIEAQVGIHILPRVAGLPTPTLTRALTLASVQFAKQLWWLVLSAPIAVVLAALWIVRWRPWFRTPPQVDRIFLLLWIVPSILFFVFGHMGQLPYLQCYLPGICIGAVTWLRGSPTLGLESPNLAPFVSNIRWSRSAALMLMMVLLVSPIFFLLARPTGAASGSKRTLDIAVLGFGGYSVRNGLNSGRLAGSTGKTLKDIANDVSLARTDIELLDAMRRTHFSPAPEFHESAGMGLTESAIH